VKFTLADDAGGRFKIVKDATGYKLAVAENLLIDHRADGDGNHVYAVQVTATDASGASSVQTLNITATGAAENRILGTAGNDTLTGGAGGDTFVFRPGFGTDTVTDFNALAGANHDILEISSGLFADFAALQGAMQQVGQNVVITADAATTITLHKVTLNTLDAGDFAFT
jgi:hypothetical protein